MSNKTEWQQIVTSLTPAPGWRVVQAYLYDDKTVEFTDLPVLGFASVRKVDRDSGLPTDDDTVELFVWDNDGAGFSCSLSEAKQWRHETTLTVFPPGEELTPERKQELTEELAAAQELSRKHKASKVVAQV